MRKLLSLLFVLPLTLTTQAQNLLNTNTWRTGSGSVSGFSQNGATSENRREYGKNHVGEKVVLWKAIPDRVSNADGGWNTGYHRINHTKTYRFSVWLKKTNSNHGTSYFGCGGNILNLSGSANSNPYFWYGDLPKLNRWYLLIGFVNGSGYSSNVSRGAIYDGVTGEKIKTITDFKFKSGATITRHRSYLFYDKNTQDRQYFYAPRLEMVTGREPSVEKLLRINRNSKLVISYDTANNQNQAFYCADSRYCSPPAAKKTKDRKDSITSVEEEKTASLNDHNSQNPRKEKYNVVVYPNPTSDVATVDISEIKNKIHSIKLYNVNSVLLKTLDFRNIEVLELDLSDKTTGIYLLHIHINGGESITKRIIKK